MPRPPKRSAHVDKLDVSPEARERLRAVLDTLAGELSMADAAERVGVKESRFYYIREHILQEAGKAAEKRSSGPKQKQRDADDVERIAELEAQLEEMRIELEAARLRTELALTMPHVLQEDPPPNGHQSRKKRQERSASGAKGGRRTTSAKGKKTSSASSKKTSSASSKKTSKKTNRGKKAKRH